MQIHCLSQAPGFNKHFAFPYSQTRIFKILVENDTIIALGDGYETDSATNEGLVLMKFDTLGNLVDSNFIHDSILSTEPVPLRWGSLRTATDGGYIMNATPSFSAYPVIVKTDHDFNLEFVKPFPDTSGHDYQLTDFISIADGYLLFGAYRRWNNTTNGYIRKIDLYGNPVWLKNYGSLTSSVAVIDIKMINDSTFSVAMVYDISTGLALSSIKIVNKNGDVLQTWNSDTNPEIGYLRDIVSVDSNGMLIYGLYVFEFAPPFTYIVQSTLSRLDNDFNVKWVKRYGKKVDISSEIMFYDFERTIDGNFVAAGRTSTVPTFEGGPTYARGWLMKFSPEGDSIWSRQDTSDLTPWHILNRHRLGGVGVLSSGSIVAGGFARHLNDYYAWLIKVTNDGCMDTLYCGLVSGVKETLRINDSVKVFPNPATTYLDVEYSPVQGQVAKFYLTDILGSKAGVYELDSYANQHRIPLDGFPIGQYFYAILEDGMRVFSGKFVKIE